MCSQSVDDLPLFIVNTLITTSMQNVYDTSRRENYSLLRFIFNTEKTSIDFMPIEVASIKVWQFYNTVV